MSDFISIAERRTKFADAFNAFVADDKFMYLLRLRATSDMSRFSIGNIMLLVAEAWSRDAEISGLFKTANAWHALGRRVTDAEFDKFYFVLKPVHRPFEDETTGEKGWALSGFRGLRQYAVEQTEGAPLPDPVPALTSADHVDELVKLMDWAATQTPVLPIMFEPIPGSCAGWYSPLSHSIVIDSEPASDEQLAVLIHEVIHSFGVGYKDFGREEAEIITETACAIVCMGLGIEHLTSSLQYVAGWAKQDPEKAIKLLDKAEKFAKQMEEATGLRSPYEHKPKRRYTRGKKKVAA